MDLYLGSLPSPIATQENKFSGQFTNQTPNNSKQPSESHQIPPKKEINSRSAKELRSGVKPCGELSYCIGFASPFHSLHGTAELTNSHGLIDLASAIAHHPSPCQCGFNGLGGFYRFGTKSELTTLSALV
jgi:hypothetical protein